MKDLCSLHELHSNEMERDNNRNGNKKAAISDDVIRVIYIQETEFKII